MTGRARPRLLDGTDGPPATGSPETGGWVSLLGTVTTRAVLTFAASMLLWSTAPAAFGWTPRVVLTGSMSPRIQAGDVVLTSATSGAHVGVGRVISFADPNRPGRTLLHRLVARNRDGTLVTKGDANPTPDPDPISASEVSGLGRLRVPLVGLPVLWARTGNWVALAALTALLALAGWWAWREGHPREHRHRGPGPPGARVSVAVLALSVLGSGVLARHVAASSFTASTDSPGDRWTAAPVLIPPNSYVSTVTADSPRFLYRLGESSGTTAADASGNNRSGTYNGSFTYGVTPQPLPRNPATAVAGNGSNTCLTSSYSASTTTYTVELWFKTDSTAGGTLASVDASTGGAIIALLRLNTTGKLTFTAYGTLNSSVNSTAAYNDNAWHYVTATLSSTTGQRLYVDGTQVSSATYPAGLNTSSGSWQFGCTISGGSGTKSAFLTGALADAAAYSTVLTAARVQAHFYAA